MPASSNRNPDHSSFRLVFENSVLVMVNSKRKTLMKKDIQLGASLFIIK